MFDLYKALTFNIVSVIFVICKRGLYAYDSKENNKNNKIPWWRDGVIIFVKVSAYIAAPVVIASFAGKYLDQKYNTGNLLFLVLIGIAFLSTIYLIWKEMKIYKKKIEKDSDRDYWMTSTEAKEYGMIDEVLGMK